MTLEEPKAHIAPANADDDNEDVHAWAQSHGINVIPNNDNNET